MADVSHPALSPGLGHTVSAGPWLIMALPGACSKLNPLLGKEDLEGGICSFS